MNVQMTLHDVLYISYAVPAGRLESFVPDILQLATVDDNLAFISIVILQSTQVRLSLLPFPRFNYNQLNLRTYINDPVSNKHSVYFLKSGVTSRFISIVTRNSGIPWQYMDLEIKVNSQEEKDSYMASGKWDGDFSINAQSCLDNFQAPAFFKNKESAFDFLVRPLIGFVGDKRRLGRFTIRHPEVNPETWILTELAFPLFMNLGIIDEQASPHSVFFLPTSNFSIYLPPTMIK